MKIIVFTDGNTREITGDEGKYWLVGENRVRKLNRSIAEVREIPDAVEIPGQTEKPQKKKSTRKKKTEGTENGECGE